MIKEHIKEGKIVPMAVTIKLLENAMRETKEGNNRFLVDGFPRQLDQAYEFDDTVSHNPCLVSSSRSAARIGC